MEQEQKFEAVLKKSVAMFNMLTGKTMTEQEGRAFIDIFDLAEAYTAGVVEVPASAEAFDVLSQVDYNGQTVEEQRDHTFHREFVEQGYAKFIPPADVLKSCDVLSASEHPPEVLKSELFDHQPGYPWRIVVIDRWKNAENSYAMHFSRLPKQEEFEEEWQHFRAQTHWVHVNHWNGESWDTITELFHPGTKKPEPEKAVETFKTTDEWEEGKNWRIKFWDQRINNFNYVYFVNKPGGMALSKYHSSKCFAVTEKRPEA